MYKLISENLTGLGGPMGTEHTWNNFVKYSHDLQKLKDFAEGDYKKPIKWKKKSTGDIYSGDLGYVMYHISKIETID